MYSPGIQKSHEMLNTTNNQIERQANVISHYGHLYTDRSQAAKQGH